jgi:hypothetical protein
LLKGRLPQYEQLRRLGNQLRLLEDHVLLSLSRGHAYRFALEGETAMTKVAKTRVFLLALAIFTTLLALTPAKPLQACLAYENAWCQNVFNGQWCKYSECPQYNQCQVGPQYLVNCSFDGDTCCPMYM